MTVLLLIRHGQTLWNKQGRYLGWTDLPLNEVGQRQAQALLAYLADFDFRAVFSSDLQRAMAIAEVTGERRDLIVQPDSRLREMDFGAIEGLTFGEAETLYPSRMKSWFSDVNETLPDAEPYSAFSARISSFLAEVRLEHPDAAVLVVTHGGPIREILRQALGLSFQGIWYFQIDPATVSEIALYKTGPLLIRLNEKVLLEINPYDS